MAQLYSEVGFPGNRRFGQPYLRARESIDEYEERRRQEESVVRPPKAAGAATVYEPAKDLGALVQEFGPEAAKGLIDYARFEQQGGVAGELARLTPEQQKAARIAGRRLKYESRVRADQLVSRSLQNMPGVPAELTGLSELFGEIVEELEPQETLIATEKGFRGTGERAAETEPRIENYKTQQEWADARQKWLEEKKTGKGMEGLDRTKMRQFRVGDKVMTEAGLRGAVERKLMERGRALGGISGEAYAVATGAPGLPSVAPKLQHIEGNTFLDPQTNTAVDIPFTPQQQAQLDNKGWVHFSNDKGDFVYRVKGGKPEVQRLMKKPPKEKRYDKTVVPGVRDAEGRETTKIIYTNPDDPSDKFVAHEEVSAPEAPKPSPPAEAFGFETDKDGKKHPVVMRMKPDGTTERMVFPVGSIPKGYESQFKDSKNVLVVKTELDYPKTGSLYEGIDKDTGKWLWGMESGGQAVEEADGVEVSPGGEPPAAEQPPTLPHGAGKEADATTMEQAVKILEGQGLPVTEENVRAVLAKNGWTAR